jgi:hypothetical protein
LTPWSKTPAAFATPRRVSLDTNLVLDDHGAAKTGGGREASQLRHRAGDSENPY